nr:NUDIX domain-containing protein [Paraburkholderia guartelaensis]
MKNRATVVCTRGENVLLVSRGNGRWALPGGILRRIETPAAAARREPEEETAIAGLHLRELFLFGACANAITFFIAAFRGLLCLALPGRSSSASGMTAARRSRL